MVSILGSYGKRIGEGKTAKQTGNLDFDGHLLVNGPAQDADEDPSSRSRNEAVEKGGKAFIGIDLFHGGRKSAVFGWLQLHVATDHVGWLSDRASENTASQSARGEVE